MPIGKQGFQKGNTYGFTNKKNPDVLKRISKERTGEGNPGWKGGKRILSICSICKKYIYDYRIRKCCSVQCSASYVGSINREKLRGKVGANANNWQGGSFRGQNYRGTKKYFWWKKKVLTKSGRKCQVCKTNKELEVDHIKPLSLILFENNIKTLEQFFECQEVWLISNGRVLCKQCHKQHQKPWKGMKKVKLGITS